MHDRKDQVLKIARRDAWDPARLTQGLGPNPGELLASLVGQRLKSFVAQISWDPKAVHLRHPLSRSPLPMEVPAVLELDIGPFRSEAVLQSTRAEQLGQTNAGTTSQPRRSLTSRDRRGSGLEEHRVGLFRSQHGGVRQSKRTLLSFEASFSGLHLIAP